LRYILAWLILDWGSKDGIRRYLLADFSNVNTESHLSQLVPGPLHHSQDFGTGLRPGGHRSNPNGLPQDGDVIGALTIDVTVQSDTKRKSELCRSIMIKYRSHLQPMT